MAKILVDYRTTPTCFGLESPSSGSYFLCLVEMCLYFQQFQPSVFIDIAQFCLSGI
jgi:hypothetical protein